MDGRSGRMTKGAKKRATRKRRQEIARLHASGRTPYQIARLLRCSVETVRQHVTAIREAARQRMVCEWGPGAAETGDLIEGIESALQKVRAAQGDTDPAKSTHRGLLQLELKTLREMIDLRRELAAARTQANADAPGGWGAFEHMSNEGLIEQARELGIDVSGFERALKLAASAAAPTHEVRSSELPPAFAEASADEVPSCDGRSADVGSDSVGPRSSLPEPDPDPSPLSPVPYVPCFIVPCFTMVSDLAGVGWVTVMSSVHGAFSKSACCRY